MCIIAFYFLLRVGEYTYHPASDGRLTKQFAVNDVALWHHSELLSPTTPSDILYLTCTAATLSIRNQKNGKKNNSVHVEAIFTDYCPVRALIRRIKHIRRNSPTLNLCLSTYFAFPGAHPRMLRAYDVNAAVKKAVIQLGLHRNGLTSNLVGSHSLRAGGAMAMYLNGVPHDTVRKMGRWQSDTFLMYIHEQIAAFSANVSTAMSKPIVFQNVLLPTRP